MELTTRLAASLTHRLRKLRGTQESFTADRLSPWKDDFDVEIIPGQPSGHGLIPGPEVEIQRVYGGE